VSVPELPDLTIVAEQLASRASGRVVAEATAPALAVMRASPEQVAELAGMTLGSASRRGKFLVLPFERDGSVQRILAVNPMLATGRACARALVCASASRTVGSCATSTAS